MSREKYRVVSLELPTQRELLIAFLVGFAGMVPVGTVLNLIDQWIRP